MERERERESKREVKSEKAQRDIEIERKKEGEIQQKMCGEKERDWERK